MPQCEISSYLLWVTDDGYVSSGLFSYKRQDERDLWSESVISAREILTFWNMISILSVRSCYIWDLKLSNEA